MAELYRREVPLPALAKLHMIDACLLRWRYSKLPDLRSARVCIGLYEPTNGVRLLLTDGGNMLCRDLRVIP